MLSDKISIHTDHHLYTAVSICIAISVLMLLASTVTASNANNESATPVTARLKKDSDAQQLIASADVQRATWSATELLAAKENYEKAAMLWTSISDYSNASLATLKAGDVCFLLGELREAQKFYNQAMLLAQKSGDRMAQGRAVSQIGLVYSYMGNNDAAKKHLYKALALLEVGENDPDATARHNYGEALSNMAEIFYSEGYFPKALDQFKQAVEFFVDDPEGQAKVHLFAGRISGGLGDAEKASTEISEALKLYRSVNNKVGEGLALSAQGLVYTFKGDQDRAIQLQRDALNIFELVGDQLGKAIALNGLGQVYEKWRQLELALPHYEDAYRLYEDVNALDFVAVMAFKLAKLHSLMKHYDQSMAYFHRCQSLSRAAKKERNLANVLSEIAIVYAAQGRRDLAAKQNRKAQLFFKSIGDIRGQATALNNYCNFFLKDQTQEALPICREAYSLSERVRDKSILLTALYNLARANNALGDYDAGLRFIQQALDISEELRANVGSPDARAAYFSGVKPYYDLCRDILMQLERLRPGEGFAIKAFFISEQSRARLLLDLVKEWQTDLREGATGALLRHEREVNATIQSLTKYQYDLSLSNSRDPNEIAEVDKRMNQLRADREEIQTKLRVQNPQQQSVVRLEPKDLEQIQKELRAANAMLLEYSLGEERSYLWAITGDSANSYELAPRKELEDATRALYERLTARQEAGHDKDYQQKVAAADSLYPEKAAQLSQMLLGPVAGQLGTKRLLLVTEGALQYMSFEALPLPGTMPTESETPSYLIQTNEIVVLPSMSTLLSMRAERNRRALPGRVVAVIADPVFAQADERVHRGESTVVGHASPVDQQVPQTLRDSGSSRLIYAGEEADAIAEAAPWGTTMVAKGFDASRETAMSLRLGEYQIVHFATHGFLDSEHPELSAIILSRVDQNGVEKNGFMLLHDISSLDLSAELTVLSACQTALGKDIKGEGMIGLTHSFMSAGSKSVVASLWKVDDRATSVLMSDFYKSMLQSGLPPVSALRAAKLKMIQDKRSSQPFYWAGFVFQGDYESRINVESNSHLSLAITLLSLVLISSGLIVFRRRRRRLSPAVDQARP